MLEIMGWVESTEAMEGMAAFFLVLPPTALVVEVAATAPAESYGAVVAHTLIQLARSAIKTRECLTTRQCVREGNSLRELNRD